MVRLGGGPVRAPSPAARHARRSVESRACADAVVYARVPPPRESQIEARTRREARLSDRVRRCPSAKAGRMTALVVLTNLPDRASAEKLADSLVEKRMAACVNILAPCRSVYRWKDAVQHDEEHPVLIKTTDDRYAELEKAIRAVHPYELPEIVAVPVERGLPAYLDWVNNETRP